MRANKKNVRFLNVKLKNKKFTRDEILTQSWMTPHVYIYCGDIFYKLPFIL